MKFSHLTYLSTLFIMSSVAHAQEFKVPLANTKEATITLKDFPGDIPIEGYSGSEVIISGDTQHETPDRAKGLKPIYPAGTDNTGQGIKMEKNGDQVTLTYLLPITHEGREYKIKIPENAYLKFTSGCERNSNVTVQNVKGEVEINICGSISLKHVSGPLVLSTISGNIDVTFTDISKDKPTSIASISGEIDVTLPAKTPATVEMSNISGAMYSDFDFHSDDKDIKRIGGNVINGQLNGGGVDLKIHDISGNIYLRKG